MISHSSIITGLLGLLGSAAAAAAATESHRQPRSKDLRRLGIDPAQFARIGR